MQEYLYHSLLPYFLRYPQDKAPFLHQQLAEWNQSKPLKGIDILHHVPLVPNTLLKIACLTAAGANVVVTNPNFLTAHPEAIAALAQAKIPYVDDLSSLRGKDFDFYLDCGAESYQKLGAPRKGVVELTGSGDQYYRQRKLNFPVLSIDQTYTKQLETVFGSAESANQAIAKLTGLNLTKKSWMIMGFGKIGRGLAYYCVQNQEPVVVVDLDEKARQAAASFGIQTVDPLNRKEFQKLLANTDIFITATGRSDIVNQFPKTWFANKVLVNMGVLDEYGEEFLPHEVLNNKLPINFILDDPTPIQFIDPELYAHNLAVLELLHKDLPFGVSTLCAEIDQGIISAWCQYHSLSQSQVTSWFVKRCNGIVEE